MVFSFLSMLFYKLHGLLFLSLIATALSDEDGHTHTCDNTNGTAANTANCACGTTDCDAATTGLFCDTSNNRCSAFAACTKTDGSAANSENCACGTTDCDATTTGLFCDDSLGNLKNKGGSGCTANKPCLECEGDCDADSHCAGDLKCFQRSSSYSVPTGCKSGGLGDVGTHDYCYRESLCMSAPYCTNTNGTAANPAPCVCGVSGACTSASGLFCDTSNNDRCSPAPTCANVDGTAANTANCACGTTDCDAATTGLF